jgi:two-component system chemotaxis response regulator CheB
MPTVLARLSAEPAGATTQAPPPDMAKEVALVTQESSTMQDLDDLGTRVPFTCPECGGTLWEVGDGAARYRCHVGHAYSLRTLAAEQGTQLEAALWAALRRLEESEHIARRMARYAQVRGDVRSATYHDELSKSSAQHADVLRRLLAAITDDTARVPQAG